VGKEKVREGKGKGADLISEDGNLFSSLVRGGAAVFLGACVLSILYDPLEPSWQRFRWVKDLGDIWWTATNGYIHSLHYEEDDNIYVWYVHDLKDFEELKKEILYPPIEYEFEFEAKDIEEAKKYVESKVSGAPAHPEKVDELVRERNKGYKRLKRWAK
jgi:hypothetical protein